MSIQLLAINSNHLLPIWLIWAGVSLMLAHAVLANRGAEASLIRIPRESAEPLMLLLPVAGLVFLTWIFASGFWVSLTHDPAVTDPPPGERALQAMIVPLVPTLLGLFLLRAKPMRQTLGLSRSGIAPGVMWGLIGIVIAMPFVWWSYQATLMGLAYFQIDHPAKHKLLLEMDAPVATWVRFAVIVAAVVVAPAFEELLFRGLLQTSLRKLTASPILAIVASSFVFAIIHEPWTAIPIFVLSVCIGVIYELTRNLIAAIVMHAAFNAMGIAFSGFG